MKPCNPTKCWMPKILHGTCVRVWGGSGQERHCTTFLLNCRWRPTWSKLDDVFIFCMSSWYFLSSVSIINGVFWEFTWYVTHQKMTFSKKLVVSSSAWLHRRHLCTHLVPLQPHTPISTYVLCRFQYQPIKRCLLLYKCLLKSKV